MQLCLQRCKAGQHCGRASAYIDLGFGTASCTGDILYFDGQQSFSLASTGTQARQIQHLDGMELADKVAARGFDAVEPPCARAIRCSPRTALPA